MKPRHSAAALAVILAGAVVALVLTTPQKASALAKPMGSLHAYKVSISDTTPVSIRTMINNGNIAMNCGIMIASVSATQVNVGGSDVDASTKFFPLCTDTTICPVAVLTVDGPADQVFVRRNSGSGAVSLYVWVGGGC
jgi:hypothetical protein